MAIREMAMKVNQEIERKKGREKSTATYFNEIHF